MGRETFDDALRLILALEGGFSNHPLDPGGATNRGITRRALAQWRGRAVSVDDVRTIGLNETAAIYRDRYWMPIRGDELQPGLDLVAFDIAVNSGVGRAVALLSGATGVPARDRMPTRLVEALGATDPRLLIERVTAHRLRFLSRLRTWSTFGRGWRARVEHVRQAALTMSDKARPRPAQAARRASKTGILAPSQKRNDHDRNAA